MPSTHINGYFFLLLFVESPYLSWGGSFYWEGSLQLSLFYSSVFHRRWAHNQFQVLLAPVPVTLSYQVQSNSGLPWKRLWRAPAISVWQCATSALPLSTHQGQKWSMVRHHVLHYLATSGEDTPREECNFKLEKKWLRIMGVKETAASRCCKTWVRRKERRQLRVN